MAIITCETGWKGMSNQGKWSNHESSLSEAEMIDLAGQISLIAGMSGDDPVGMDAKFKAVRAALASSTATIKITKGIHQRDSKAHFDIVVSGTEGGTFHVFVIPGVATSHTGGKSYSGKTIVRQLAAYIPSGLSVNDGVIKTWPSQFKLAELEKPVGRPRGYSLSIGNSLPPPTFLEATTKNPVYYAVN
ncbi:hypothetical protein AruPA_11005 [Acidiphilium sp. PA]|uniref:hypothetical protein n=1 Tax=Acidiphilium sp. PA TaxID=2871705 RepID=UPI00224404B7|nr:hypothetical protein [Acidiphilium sp. PA]MCW8307567.1 hypothetical protein [Acidiphilium sp. PA]